MAELNVFGYQAGQSLAHRLDVRVKLVDLLLLTSAVVAASPSAMGPLTLGAVLLWGALRMPLRPLGHEMRAFLLFLALIFATRALSTPGDPVLAWGGLVVTREGLWQGALVVWRLLMILALGLIFIRTTRPVDLKGAVQWLLGPVPFVPAAKAATMVGLIVRFIPVLHLQILETRSALAARAGVRRPLSLRRARYLVLPTMRRVVLAADQLALAMTARNYSENRTGPSFRFESSDALALLLAGAVLAFTGMV
jgi:energy-coupling factor transporter transmembrane protein EcfT